jgi:DNA recombination protein RmuC
VTANQRLLEEVVTSIIIALLGGIAIGLTVAFVLRIQQAKQARELAEELFREADAQRKASIDAVIDNVKASFGAMSLEALSKSTDEFLKLAKARLDTERETSARELDSKKGLIDQQLQAMTVQMEQVSRTINELEKDRVEKFGQLSSSLLLHSEQTQSLMQTTNALRQALSSTKARGQWGERMAEDVLRLAGFIEDVNYEKQKRIDSSGKIPDFTFFLPQDLKLNMDVKFPLDNYLRYQEATSESDKSRHMSDFLKDVRGRVKEVATREYINPEQNTVDYVLLFIPNEQVYAFIHEQDRKILDDALSNKVVFCSPLTLYAILAVIRRAVDNFTLEKTSHQILALYGEFQKQWTKFVEKMDSLGKKIRDAQEVYEEVTTTRRRQLDRVLDKIGDLRTQTGLPDGTSNLVENNTGEDRG